MNLHQITLSNGIRVVAEAIPTVQSLTVSLWIRAGSRDETPQQHGIAHFLEHMLFKGTHTRSAAQIAQAIEGRGGVLNASTGKELTFYYARMLAEHMPIAVEVLSDLFLNARLDPDDIELEKGVILEEMRMIEDTPDEILHDRVMEVYWGDHPLARRIIGTPQTVGAFTRDMIRDFIETHYRPERVVVAAAGNLDPDTLFKEVDRWLGRWNPEPRPSEVPSQSAPTRDPNAPPRHIETRDVEQTHFALVMNGVSFFDERRYAQAVLNTLLGGSMFSRLWQEVREKRGLAYEIGSYAMPMSDAGLFVIYSGVAPTAFEQAVAVIETELDKLLAEPPSEEEVVDARNLLKGNRVLALESTQSRAELIGSETLMRGAVPPMEEIIAEIDAVTPEHLHTLAQQLLAPEQRILVAITPQ
ncbi:MAG: peptidase M16 [Armatimonadetes bacterium JP3_11]|jgi:predicted Zn-dependent peptidase|nr:MAG: peptidase M16 [Armatimonadetes bacterium CP1_7O]OYT75115.1 MAG: peptidase M16 [Armatimonadetes bacterium JP3_11]RMH10413.1 MAG: insulinase family protein [Armatimonadota bacterium]